jgi:hypothetical protein
MSKMHSREYLRTFLAPDQVAGSRGQHDEASMKFVTRNP